MLRIAAPSFAWLAMTVRVCHCEENSDEAILYRIVLQRRDYRVQPRWVRSDRIGSAIEKAHFWASVVYSYWLICRSKAVVKMRVKDASASIRGKKHP